MIISFVNETNMKENLQSIIIWLTYMYTYYKLYKMPIIIFRMYILVFVHLLSHKHIIFFAVKCGCRQETNALNHSHHRCISIYGEGSKEYEMQIVCRV